MKIFMIGYNLEQGRKEAINKQVFNISKNLVLEGNEVSIISISNHEEITKKEGVVFYSFKGLKSIFKIKKFIEKERPDIIHDHFGLLGSSFLTLFLTKNFGCKKIKTIYATQFKIKDILKASYYLLFNDFFYEIFPRFFLDNKFVRILIFKSFQKLVFINNLQKLNEGKHQDSIYIPPFISLPKENKDKERLKKKLKIGRNDKIILYLGHASRKKGIFQIANCLKLFKEEDNIKFLFAFSGMGSEEKKFIKKYKKHKKQIRFSNKDNISDIYSISDVFILPLLFPWGATTTPLTILESLKSKTPVITTKNKYLKNIIQECNNGIILVNLSSKKLKESILFFLNRENNKLITWNSSKDKIRESKEEKIAKLYLNIYKQVLV